MAHPNFAEISTIPSTSPWNPPRSTSGGAIRLWDYHEQWAAAPTDWILVKTQFGFPVRARAIAFFDKSLSVIANRNIEREAHFQSLAQRIGLAS